MHTQVLQRRRLGSGTLGLLLVGASLVLAPPSLRSPAPTSDERSSPSDYAQLPLRFEENVGQEDERVRYIARASGYTAFFAEDHITWSVPGRDRTAAITMRPVGANPKPPISHGERLPGVSNYLRGSDPSGWVSGAKAYSKITYEDVWDGVDVVFRQGPADAIEYDLIVAPGVQPSIARFVIGGARDVTIDGRDLVVETSDVSITQRAPRAYQMTGVAQSDVAVDFVLDGNAISFDVGKYDRTRSLIIDPVVLSYSTFLGGTSTDAAEAIYVDGAGNAYVTGWSSSADYPVCTGSGSPSGCSGAAFDTTESEGDIFVTKLNAAGNQLVYSTFLGGSSDDYGMDVAVDGSGNAYVAGGSSSTDYPVCTGAGAPTGCVGASFQTTQTDAGNEYDAVVTKLNSTGNGLLYSTFLGGTGQDEGLSIDVDASGNAHVAGDTTATNFPVCTGVGTPTGCAAASFQPTKAGTTNEGFVTKLNVAGNALVYSTYLGASGDEFAEAIDLGPSGTAFVAGWTTSNDFPVCTGAGTPAGCASPGRDISLGGTRDAFVTQLDATGTTLVYSTYIGGSSSDQALGLAVDGAGNAYVGGHSSSLDFPVCTGPGTPAGCGTGSFQTTKSLDDDGFVTKVGAGGSTLMYSTYLGGAEGDVVRAVGVDGSGRAHVTGLTSSSNFPVCSAPGTPAGCEAASFQTVYGGGATDAFVTNLDAVGSGLVYSTYLGGDGFSEGLDIAVDATSAPYIVGRSIDANYPVCTGDGEPSDCRGPSFQSSSPGANDAFVTKLEPERFRPDALIKKAAAVSYAGDGRYNTTAAGQTVTSKVRRGRSVAFDVRFENDGSEPVDRFTIDGCASSTGFRVRYRDGNGVDVTAQVAAGTYQTPNLAPGESHDIDLVIKAKQSAQGRKRCAVQASSEQSGVPKIDVVRGDARVRG